MASCVRNFCAKNYQNLLIGFHAAVENVGMFFWGDTVYSGSTAFIFCSQSGKVQVKTATNHCTFLKRQKNQPLCCKKTLELCEILEDTAL